MYRIHVSQSFGHYNGLRGLTRVFHVQLVWKFWLCKFHLFV